MRQYVLVEWHDLPAGGVGVSPANSILGGAGILPANKQTVRYSAYQTCAR